MTETSASVPRMAHRPIRIRRRNLTDTLGAGMNWRSYVPILLVWVTFEDALRKYTGGDILVFFLKELLLLWVYFLFFASQPRRLFHLPRAAFWLPLGMLFTLAVAQAFNPTLPDFRIALIGLHNQFLYVPLVLVTYHYIQSIDDLIPLLRLMALSAIVIAGVGLAQVIIGPHFLNPENLSAMYRYEITRGTLFRIASLFIDIGRYALYLLMVFYLLLGGLLTLRSMPGRRALQLMMGFALLLVVLGALTSGTRSTLGLVAMGLVIVGLIKAPGLLMQIGIFLIVASIPLALIFSKDFDRAADFLNTYMFNPTQWGKRLDVVAYEYTKPELLRNLFTGNGTGSNSLGVQHLYGGKEPFSGSESGVGAMVFAYGMFGGLIWIWFTWSVVFTMVRNYLISRATPYAGFLLAASLLTLSHLVLLNFVSPQSFENYIGAFYLWFTVGIALKLGWLARESAARRQTSSAPFLTRDVLR